MRNQSKYIERIKYQWGITIVDGNTPVETFYTGSLRGYEATNQEIFRCRLVYYSNQKILGET
ncbi:MAG: hypothetical protein ACTMUB_09960 [cyanobacterium endosymbiont of Rhopalodia musculus]